MVDLQADDRPLDDGQFTLTVQPGGPVGEAWVQPVPGAGDRGAIAGRLGGRGVLWVRPGGRVGEAELAAVLGRPTVGAGTPRRRGQPQDPIRAHPAQYLDRQVGQQERQPGDVVPGVEDDPGCPGRRPSTARPPASRSMTSRTWSAVTAVSSSPGPRRTASSSAVHEVRPTSSAATKEYGQPGMNCEALLARPCTWQNNRSGDVAASGRNHGDTSTASTIRPSTARGNGRPASAARNRATSRRPRFSPS